MARAQRLYGAALVVLAALVTAGCAPTTPPPGQLVGKDLEQTQDSLGGPFIIIDITPNVIDQPAAYNDGKDPAGWSVLVACASDSGEGYVVGVIPKASATTSIIRSAKAGDYDS
ncbi:MAG: hypothetical protein B7X41_19365, partial [Microbacterium sp. 14-71-5]